MPGGVFADGQVACWDRLRRGLGLGPESWVAVFILTLPLNPADHPSPSRMFPGCQDMGFSLHCTVTSKTPVSG